MDEIKTTSWQTIALGISALVGGSMFVAIGITPALIYLKWVLG